VRAIDQGRGIGLVGEGGREGVGRLARIGEGLTLVEHRPSFTSEITLTIDGGLDLNNPEDVKKKKDKKPFAIKTFSFFVFFKRQ
jgi:hypothetical protein